MKTKPFKPIHLLGGTLGLIRADLRWLRNVEEFLTDDEPVRKPERPERARPADFDQPVPVDFIIKD